MTRISTVNLNGIRAASRRGLGQWLERESPDVLLMQEVRADAPTARELLGGSWRLSVVPSRIKGRAGVAVAVRAGAGEAIEVSATREILDEEETDADSGRWLEVDLDLASGTRLTVVSAYFHSGEVGSPKEEAKMAHLPRVGARMAGLLAEARRPDGRQALVAGDFNIVRSRADIKNWTSNHNKHAGVLDEEIAFLTGWVGAGWRDVTRDLAGDVQGPYTWWSWRGKAFDNDTGWRIDYQFATPLLAEHATGLRIGRADSYDARFSDHAPLSIDYDL
ncbi:exodeoxyribonuclease III [Schaalia naturae]|jgi:exodeoxyribonuclease-3|uniref:Exodeoxyribonuclease III n=1 Tax=Schaalia naturae TaxID=635203 RepID=A0ABW2SM97_9ACTO